MKKINELRDYLLENYVDNEGDLYLSGLDFSNFDGDIYVNRMKVKGDLSQYGHEIQGSLYQDSHYVKGDYHTTNIKVSGTVYQNEIKPLLKSITREELEKMGYELKEEEK